MSNKNTVAAILAVMAMVGFLTIFAILGFGKVPPENKDFFNMGFIALIGFVGTAFGYYLGSSVGSAQKNELLAQAVASVPPSPDAASPVVPALIDAPADAVTAPTKAPTAPLDANEGSEAGYIRLSSLLFLATAFAFIIYLTGCATTGTAPTTSDTAQMTAGKSLLAVKSAIVVAATSVDTLCTNGTLKHDVCTEAKATYEQSKPAYDAAVDAYLLLTSQGGDNAAFQAALIRVQALAADLALITGGGK